MEEKITLLSTSLLDEERPVVENLRRLAGELGQDFGWHYLLDLTWILRELPQSARQGTILDAGAGVGLLQWYLAEQGAHVLSVDRLDRAHLSLRFRGRFSVDGFRTEDLQPFDSADWGKYPSLKAAGGDIFHGITGLVRRRGTGRVTLYHQDLADLKGIPDNSMDAVVSVSALEHNSHEGLRKVVLELMRVLKPGGRLLATLTAGCAPDWFHQSSQGWCFTAKTLRDLFGLSNNVPDNYADYDSLLDALRNCAELRDHLAHFYFESGDNGMPWGKWDPQYLPVGVCKIKK
jgi:SAM-dependent methyltransferase